MALGIMRRAEEILAIEGIQYDKKVLAQIVQNHFPDFRRVLNELQRYSVSGCIDAGILVNLDQDNFNVLITALKEKKYIEVRKWVAQNSDVDTVKLFGDLYKIASEKMVAKSIPELVLVLAKYQYQAAFVADQEINTMAALTELMMGVEWK